MSWKCCQDAWIWTIMSCLYSLQTCSNTFCTMPLQHFLRQYQLYLHDDDDRCKRVLYWSAVAMNITSPFNLLGVLQVLPAIHDMNDILRAERWRCMWSSSAKTALISNVKPDIDLTQWLAMELRASVAYHKYTKNIANEQKTSDLQHNQQSSTS